MTKWSWDGDVIEGLNEKLEDDWVRYNIYCISV